MHVVYKTSVVWTMVYQVKVEKMTYYNRILVLEKCDYFIIYQLYHAQIQL